MDDMKRGENKVVVITGGSSDTSHDVMKNLLLNGFKVIGIDKNIDEIWRVNIGLPQNIRPNLSSFACDVTNVESVNEIFDKIIEKFGGIDILINSADCYNDGKLCEMSTEDIQQVVRKNVMGVIYCTQRAVKCMKERNRNGHIIIIKNINDRYVAATHWDKNIYCASISALTAIAEVFRQEFNQLKTKKIKITSIRNIKQRYDHRLFVADMSSAVMYVISRPPHVEINEMTVRPLVF